MSRAYSEATGNLLGGFSAITAEGGSPLPLHPAPWDETPTAGA